MKQEVNSGVSSAAGDAASQELPAVPVEVQGALAIEVIRAANRLLPRTPNGWLRTVVPSGHPSARFNWQVTAYCHRRDDIGEIVGLQHGSVDIHMSAADALEWAAALIAGVAQARRNTEAKAVTS